MQDECFLEIRDATVWRGDTPALKDFSLQLRHGESVAILGPNGAGKSTLLKVLTGEVRPEAKPETRCRLFGEDLWSLEELRHKIGVVMPEDVARFHPEELAQDVVLSSLRGAFGRTRDMRFSAKERAAADRAIERLGVESLKGRDFGTLSSGERRRFLIARALVHDPPVLVLVTHHPGEIPPEIGRVILLDQGRIRADGAKRKVLGASALSGLFQVPLKVSWPGGWCDVRPA